VNVKKNRYTDYFKVTFEFQEAPDRVQSKVCNNSERKNLKKYIFSLVITIKD
jgi:hypothetical protein